MYMKSSILQQYDTISHDQVTILTAIHEDEDSDSYRFTFARKTLETRYIALVMVTRHKLLES